MEEVRQLVQEEGREARNLVAFHVSVDTPAHVTSRPPLWSGRHRSGVTRLRSASAGRDKRSELRARYWALLFADLQRAVGEIYNTVEQHENLSECQEVILVLENYTRDFKALCEWFRLKWEYDNTPPPQRPRSLAWEIRKSDFVRPEVRKSSVRSSPSVSGKNSPCFSGHNTPSGKNSPNLSTGKVSPASGKISPRISSVTSPKGNIEFFSSKVNSKVTTKPEPKAAKDVARLSDIKEKVDLDAKGDDTNRVDACNDSKTTALVINVEPTKKTSPISPKQVIMKASKAIDDEIAQQARATIEKLNVMECAFLEKQLIENAIKNENMLNQDRVKDLDIIAEKFDSKVKEDKIENLDESPIKSEDNFADVSSDSSPKSTDDTKESIQNKTSEPTNKHSDSKLDKTLKDKDVKSIGTSTADFDKDKPSHLETGTNESETNKREDYTKESQIDPKKEDTKKVEPKPVNKPAYSQAAAKPKIVSAVAKVDAKVPVKTVQLARSRTVVEIRPNTAPKLQKFYPKRSPTNKCSYPFNLTTGRTSLFDAHSNKPGTKKPLGKSVNALNESKTKIEVKKPPPKRPTTLKVNEKGDKKEKLLKLDNLKDCDEYSSSETVVTQIDMSRIESSESLMTLVAEDGVIHDVTNSIEVLNVDGSKNDNEGWLTVKSRRLSRESKKQSKSHWSNRFNQPSATTSLPTLNMVDSPKQEYKPILSESKFDRAKSEQPQIERKIEKTVKVVMKIKEKSKNTSIIRQKSDVTGLKTRSARNKALAKKEKNKDAKRHLDGCELVKNRLHSSLESLTGLARSQESTEDAFDFDKWKSEFKSTFKYLDYDDHMSGNQDFLKTADPTEMSEIAQMTSQIEENERKISLALDFQSEVDQRKLSEEEDLLNRQIMELQQVSDVDIDTETDDTETDAEIHCDDHRPPLPIQCPSPEPLGPLAASLEDQYESALAGMSWAERVDTLGVLEALVARDPGRAQQLHAKLSQGIKRRGSLQDALRRLQAKQSRAERHRLELQTERTKRIQVLLARVEEVKVAKNQLIDEKRLRMERRLQKAAENRDQHIKDIVRKAHDEEEKLREILFIKQLEAENRRHEFLEQCRSHTYRLREMRRDRLDKLEQKAAREAAVGARRLALEEARRLHVSTLVEKRKERDARREEMREMRRQERDDANREKAENVKSRLEALAIAAELEVSALRSRIEDKHIATRLRLETHLQAIRSRATQPRIITTSESHDHLKEECEQEHEIQIAAQDKKDRDKVKLVKKKARKLRQKMLLAGQEYEEISLSEIPQPLSSNNKVAKILIQINNVLNSLQTQNENKNDTKPLQNGIDNNNSQTKNDNSQNKNEKSQNKNEKSQNKHDNSQNKNDVCQKENTNERKKSRRNRKAASEEKQSNINSSINGSKESTPDILKNDAFIEQKSDIDKEQSNTKCDIDTEKCNTESDINKEQCNTKNEIDITLNAKNENDINKNNKSETSSGKKSKSSKKKRENSRNSDSSDIYHSKNDSDKLKLIKTPSVTSSMSDMSKISAKSDKKYTNIDWMYFEKIINELNRSIDKKDEKGSKDIPVFGIRTITQLLAYAVDKDDTSIQVSAKCITTCIQLITRLTSRCAAAATSFIHTNCCLHVAKILAMQIEKDQEFDRTELQLVKSAIDCLHHAIASVVYTTNLYEQAKQRQQTLDKERLLLSSLRTRAFGLVSYVCMSGCLSRQELPDDVTEELHALVTVSARICLPCDVDTGNERQAAMTSLRLSLTPNLCGGRTALCSLLAAPRDVRNVLVLCALMSALAEMDYKFIQESFGSGRWPLEFRAVVAHLLTLHAPSDRDAPPTGCQGKEDVQMSENIALNLIVLIGYILVNNTQLQETICDNWTAIKTLCNLPASWIVCTHRHTLLPTLAVLSQHAPAAQSIAKEMCLEMIEEYIESPEAQNEKLVQLIKEGRKKINKKPT